MSKSRKLRASPIYMTCRTKERSLGESYAEYAHKEEFLVTFQKTNCNLKPSNRIKSIFGIMTNDNRDWWIKYTKPLTKLVHQYPHKFVQFEEYSIQFFGRKERCQCPIAEGPFSAKKGRNFIHHPFFNYDTGPSMNRCC